MMTKVANGLRVGCSILGGALALSAGAQDTAVSVPPGFPSARAGTVEVAPLSRAPMNATMKSALLARRAAQKSRGWVAADEEQSQTIDGYYEDDQVKRRLKHSLTDIQPDLQVVPAQLEGTFLGTAKIEGVMPAGGFVNGRWTGLARAMTAPDLGRVVLEEYDYRAAGSQIVIAEELVDSELNGYPVLFNIWRTPSGKTWTELRWFTVNKEFRLFIGKELKKGERLYEQVHALMAGLT